MREKASYLVPGLANENNKDLRHELTLRNYISTVVVETALPISEHRLRRLRGSERSGGIGDEPREGAQSEEREQKFLDANLAREERDLELNKRYSIRDAEIEVCTQQIN